MTIARNGPGDRAGERRLLESLRAGEDGAYEELVRDHGPRMLAVARRFLRDEEESRDAVQDAFLSAFRSLEGFQGQARLSTWLHRIVVNASLMKLRTRRRRPERPIEDFLPEFLEDGHMLQPAAPWRLPGDEALERRQLRELVLEKVHELPEGYRNVLLLRDIEGLDTEETARTLGLGAGAVKTRLHRARQALRGLLEPHLGEGPS